MYDYLSICLSSRAAGLVAGRDEEAALRACVGDVDALALHVVHHAGLDIWSFFGHPFGHLPRPSHFREGAFYIVYLNICVISNSGDKSPQHFTSSLVFQPSMWSITRAWATRWCRATHMVLDGA